MIYLVEHFYSIQGEGRFVGTPSLFFRFGGCNLKCEGFGCSDTTPDGKTIIGCDTIYAASSEFKQSWVAIKTADELISILELYDLPPKVDVVLSGGEPLIYADEPIFVEFLEKLDQKSHRVTFETNGTIEVDFELFPIYKKMVFALSVKLSNSLEPYAKRVKPKVLSEICQNSRDAFFKFSIDSDSINCELENEIELISSICPNLQIYCMPVGGNRAEVEKNSMPLIEFCKSKGYSFSDRLHIRLWDKDRGV
ncbi:MAG: 7-carboxy-7-deazaguanine synthase QueE [Sulfurimonas sp.]|jgi:organic radical activating enzyme|nr:7-carboxy-7-deazaguanine synthase QueE [Sulfurimonadaceae bacterium]